MKKMLFLTMMTYSIGAMNFDEMPRDIVGKIMTEIAKNVGTQELINEADIPVIVKYIKAFSLTNKSLYRKTNDIIAARMLVKTIAQRFNMDPIRVVGLIKTPGAWNWLKAHLEGNGEYEQFKIMQRIFEIGSELRAEFKQLGFDIMDVQEGWSGSNSYFGQMKQGFYLLLDRTPNELNTPWGKVTLFNGGSGYVYLFDAFTQEFMKRFKVAFIAPAKREEGRNPFWRERDRVDFYEVIQDDIKSLVVSENGKLIDYTRKLTADEVQQRNGTEKIIFNSLCGQPTIYKLLEVDGNPLPEPKVQDQTLYRSSETTKMIWKILSDRYYEEKGIIQQKSEITVKQPSASEEIRKEPEYILNSVEHASQRVIDILATVDRQPLFDGRGSMVKKCKVIPLENSADCRAIEILCKAAGDRLGADREWDIHTFGFGNSHLCDANGRDLGRGISQWIYKNKQQTRCSLAELQVELGTIMHQMVSGWTSSTLAQNPDIFHRESEEEWILLIKPESFQEEEILIRCFASTTGLDKAITCYDYWDGPNGAAPRDTLYLWIRKKEFDRVVQTFGLKINTMRQEHDNFELY